MKSIAVAISYILLCVLLACATLQLMTEGVDAKTAVVSDTLQRVRARGKLVLGVPSDDPPFGFDEKGVLKGVDIDMGIDMGEALSEEIFGKPNRVEFLRVSVDTMLDLLKSGKIDVLLVPMTITPERKKELDFTIPISCQVILFWRRK